MKTAMFHLKQVEEVNFSIEVSEEQFQALEHGAIQDDVIEDFWDIAFAELDSEGECEVDCSYEGLKEVPDGSCI